MRTYKLFLAVAFVCVVVMPSEAGDLVKAATEDAKPIAMGECLSTCKDADCLRNCIATVEAPLGPRAATQQSLDGCFEEALRNITSCAVVILLRADELEFDVHSAFWTCVTVASEVFDQCPFDAAGLSGESETILRRVSLTHLVDAAEDDYNLFVAGGLATKYPKVAITADGGDVTPPQEQREAEPKKTFAECAAEWIENRATCGTLCGQDSTCLTECEGVAKQVFQQCAGVKPTPKK